jgi:hypothetical protein
VDRFGTYKLIKSFLEYSALFRIATAVFLSLGYVTSEEKQTSFNLGGKDRVLGFLAMWEMDICCFVLIVIGT